jgi:hypothetical protein
MSIEWQSIVEQFQIGERLVNVSSHKKGHINETYVGVYEGAGGRRRYIHQRINDAVFPDPESLMHNIELVTGHLRQKVAEQGGDPEREVLTLVPTVSGQSYLKTPEGDYWRTYQYVERACSYDVVTDLRHVRNAARAFGRFQRLLADFPAQELVETIPRFHDMHDRLDQFRRALEADAEDRASHARPEISFVMERADEVTRLADLLADGHLPIRVTHNDTKFNNVMIDEVTGEAICVIDLDTVMPGTVLYDFGDAVRTGANPAAEDERDLSHVCIDMSMFEQLARGYLEATQGFLVPAEMRNLVFSTEVMAFIIGLRFLTDYLSGDWYFRTHRPDQNLDRCRVQFAFVESIEAHFDQMEEVVAQARR